MKSSPEPRKTQIVFLFVIFSLLSFGAFAQGEIPVTATALRSPVSLYVHLDKMVYQPLEPIWFTAYILNRDVEVMQGQNTLYAVLVDPVTRSVISKQRFLIQNGLSKGALSLPDTIAAGEYWLLAYTNALLETADEPVFHRLISVRTGIPSPFQITSSKFEEQGDSLLVRYRIGAANKEAAAGGQFTYTLYDKTHALRSGQQIIDSLDEVTIPIGQRQDTGKYRELAVTISHGAFSKRLFFPVYTGKSLAPETSVIKDSPTVDVTMMPDSSNYHQRSRVSLHIRIRNGNGHPLAGTFSLSVVASGRMGPNPPRPITWYDRFPETSLYSIGDLKDLTGSMPDYGYILEDNHKTEKPVTLTLMGNSFTSFKTDSAGKFALPWSTLIASEGASNYLTVTGKSPDRYKIILYSRADSFDKRLAEIHYAIDSSVYPIVRLEEEELYRRASPQTLSSALVQAKVSELDYTHSIYNSTHCDQDYVCTHHHGSAETPGILNCPYMSANGACELVKPKEGKQYVYVPQNVQYEKQHGTLLISYHCVMPPVPAFIKALDPILREKPSPAPNTAEQGLPGSSLRSTIYWNHTLTTDANGELTVSFYTNDLTGNFTCSLQGVSSEGVISGTAGYAVVRSRPFVVDSSPDTYSKTAVKVQ